MEQQKSLKNLNNGVKVGREYYMCGSSLLHKALIELGYTLEKKKESSGLNQLSVYTLGDRTIKQGYTHIEVFIDYRSLPHPTSRYKGRTISKDLLVFFTTRKPIDFIKNDTVNK